jgi:hypothetical protein
MYVSDRALVPVWCVWPLCAGGCSKAVAIANTSWPTVNCTSMESGCHDCVGPIPSTAVVEAAAKLRTAESVTLLPFGATDIRMGVLPASWQ